MECLSQTTREENAEGDVQDGGWGRGGEEGGGGVGGRILCASSKLRTGEKRLSWLMMTY